jgi:TP901 family phage tail tape measure protein
MADPQGAVLGNAIGYVDINTSGVTRNLNDARNQFGNFIQSTGAMMSQWGSQLAGFGSQLTMFTAPLAVAGGFGLKVASDFDSVLTEIQARTGLTVEAMGEVRQAALNAGAETAFSSQQAADALLNLLTAGLSTEEALATLPAVLDAAAAGGIDLASAADYTTSVMASFGLTAQDTTTIVNAMAAASAASPATMNEMGVALQRVGGMAASFGLDVEETSAILAIFAQTGLRGSDAGTALASLLRNMQRDVPGTTAAWDALGTSLYNADGTMRNLDDVFRDIEVGLAGMTDEQRNRVIQDLAGAEGMVAFNALLASEGIADMQTAMDSQASAADVAQQMMSSFAGQVDSLMGSVETLWITVLTPFMNNVLRPLIGMAIESVNAFTAWAAANEPLVQTIVTIAAAVTGLGPVLWGIGQGLQFFGFILAAIGSPIGLVVTAVGALAYVFREELSLAFQAARDGWELFAYFFNGTGDLIGSALAGVNQFLLNFSQAMGMSTDSAVGMVTAFSQGFTSIRNTVSAFMRFFSIFVNYVQDFGLGEAIMGIFGQGNLDETMQSTLEGFLFNLGFVRSEAIRITNEAWGVFSHWYLRLRSIFMNVAQVVGQTIGFIREAFSILIFRDFVSFGSGLHEDNPIFNFFFNLRDFITGTVIPALGMLIEWVGATVQSLTAWAAANPELVNTFLMVAPAIAGVVWAITSISGAIAGVMPFIAGLGATFALLTSPVALVIAGVAALAAAYFTNFGGIKDYIDTQVWPAFLEFFTWLGNVWTMVAPALSNLGNWFLTDVIPQVVGILFNNLIPLIGSVIQWLSDIWLLAQPHLLALADWFLVTGLPFVQSFISNDVLPLIQNLIGGLSALWTDVSPYLTSLFDWFMNTGLVVVKDFIFNDVLPVTQNLIDLFAGIWDAISPGLTQFYDWVMNTGLKAISDWLGGAATLAINAYVNAWGAILDVINRGITSMREFLGLQGQQAGTYSQLGGGGYQAHLNGVISGAATNAYNQITGFATGINFVPNDMIAQIHQGEAIVPANMNPYNPNAQMNGLGGGKQFSFGDIIIENITASTPQEARAMGDAFGDAFMRKLQNSGAGEEI